MVSIRVGRRLGAELQARAGGRALVIDYFASTRCGTAVGDITADFGPAPPPGTHVMLDEVQGVPVYAEHRLVPLLEEAGPRLERRRLPFGPRVTIRLDRPELWLSFLERPGITVGKSPWPRRPRPSG